MKFSPSLSIAAIALLFAAGLSSCSSSGTIAFDDPGYNLTRSRIDSLLEAKEFHPAIRLIGDVSMQVTRKRGQPKFLQQYQLMDLQGLAAQAYSGLDMKARIVISYQQIILLCPRPTYSSPAEQAMWTRAFDLANTAVHQLVNLYIKEGRQGEGIDYFESVQQKNPKNAIGSAAEKALIELRWSKN